MLRAVIDLTRAATGADVCSLYRWDPDGQELVLTATNGLRHLLVRPRPGGGSVVAIELPAEAVS